MAIERGARGMDVEVVSGWSLTFAHSFHSLFKEIFSAGQTLENEFKY